MRSLYIVEDEPYMHNYLTQDIDWESMGLRLAADFYDGESAFKAIIRQQPDIVITDIKMPKMDGIELINKSVLMGYHTGFLVISGYDDFHLVKDAFKLGVFDYLLKAELTDEDLRRAIGRLQATLETQTAGKDVLEEEKFAKKLIWGSNKSADLSEELLKRNIRFQNVWILRIELVNYEEIVARSWNGERELLSYGMRNILHEIFSEYTDVFFFLNSYSEICMVNFNSDKTAIRSYANQLLDILKEDYGFDVAAGLSGQGRTLSSLQDLYEEAVSACRYAFVHGLNIVNEAAQQEKRTFDPQLILTKFKENLIKQDFQTIISQRREYFLREGYDVDCLLKLYSGLAYEINGYLKKEAVTTDQKTAENVEEQIVGILQECSRRTKENTDILAQAEKYVKENYYKNLSLKDVAEYFHVNYFSLSKQFSARRKLSFNKYLTEIRMQNAAEMLRTTDFKINEIAAMCGYQNYETFSRTFHKRFGVWPSEYREIQ